MIRQGSITQASARVSRRTLLRALGVSGGALALGGCASLAGSETAQFYSSRIAANPTVLAATTRKSVNGGRAKPWYGPDRGPRTPKASRSHRLDKANGPSNGSSRCVGSLAS
jgi:hypothetical protein